VAPISSVIAVRALAHEGSRRLPRLSRQVRRFVRLVSRAPPCHQGASALHVAPGGCRKHGVAYAPGFVRITSVNVMERVNEMTEGDGLLVQRHDRGPGWSQSEVPVYGSFIVSRNRDAPLN